MKKERPVLIEWYDACYNSGYYDANNKERFEPALTRTAGFLVKSDRNSVIVCQDRFYNTDNTIDERHLGTIPRKMIKRITYLGEHLTRE